MSTDNDQSPRAGDGIPAARDEDDQWTLDRAAYLLGLLGGLHKGQRIAARTNPSQGTTP